MQDACTNSSHKRAAPQGPWFFSPRCKEAYRRLPQTYELPQSQETDGGNCLTRMATLMAASILLCIRQSW